MRIRHLRGIGGESGVSPAFEADQLVPGVAHLVKWHRIYTAAYKKIDGGRLLAS